MAIAVDALGGVFQRVAAHEGRDARGVLHVFDHPADLAAGFVDGFSLFGGQGRGDVVEALLECLLQPEQVPGSGHRRCLAPLSEGLPRSRNGPIHVLGRSACNGGNLFPLGGVPYIADDIPIGLNPFSVDIMLHQWQ